MRAILLTALCALAACASDPKSSHADAPSPTDASPPDGAPTDAFASDCGHPGDQGNELGVGKFCATLNDCADTPSAGLCSNLGDANTYFCTRICQDGGAADQCGTGATCTCDDNGAGCGCTPTTCL